LTAENQQPILFATDLLGFNPSDPTLEDRRALSDIGFDLMLEHGQYVQAVAIDAARSASNENVGASTRRMLPNFFVSIGRDTPQHCSVLSRGHERRSHISCCRPGQTAAKSNFWCSPLMDDPNGELQRLLKAERLARERYERLRGYPASALWTEAKQAVREYRSKHS
jgi:hypothetical protein